MSGGGGSWLTSSQKPSKPAGETIPSMVLGPALMFVNLCGISRGAKTNDLGTEFELSGDLISGQ